MVHPLRLPHGADASHKKVDAGAYPSRAATSEVALWMVTGIVAKHRTNLIHKDRFQGKLARIGRDSATRMAQTLLEGESQLWPQPAGPSRCRGRGSHAVRAGKTL